MKMPDFDGGAQLRVEFLLTTAPRLRLLASRLPQSSDSFLSSTPSVTMNSTSCGVLFAAPVPEYRHHSVHLRHRRIEFGVLVAIVILTRAVLIGAQIVVAANHDDVDGARGRPCGRKVG